MTKLENERPQDVYDRAVRGLLAAAWACKISPRGGWSGENQVKAWAFRLVAAWLAMQGDEQAIQVSERLERHAQGFVP